ncbi:MAG: permease [Candidatus Aenigmarchaeota archaeon]|nr:permease [Candidatus Aenigmarchaeota archaeon]
MNEKIKDAIVKSWRSLWNSTPILLGVILLVGLAHAIIPKGTYGNLFSKNPIIDSLIGSTVGSILAGNPVTSYVLGGELIKDGVSLVAVTSFLVAWVTVGIVQMPAESLILGKRFSILRNLMSFILSMVTAIITVVLVSML